MPTVEDLDSFSTFQHFFPDVNWNHLQKDVSRFRGHFT